MRKLAAAALGFSFAMLISRYILPYNRLLLTGAVIFAAAAILAVVPALFAKIKLQGNAKTRTLIMLFSLSLGFMWSAAYTAVFLKPYWEAADETVQVEAIVSGFPAAREPRGYHVDVSLREITYDGTAYRYPAAGMRLYYYDEAELEPGDRISVTALLRRTDINDEGERFDLLSSKGIFFSGYVKSGIEITGGSNGIRYLPAKTAQNTANKIREIYPADVSGFLTALLTGKREELYKDAALSAALTGSGIIHVVAISGMHISFLMGFLSLIIRNKRMFAIYGIPALIFFMAMTGFTPAVTRAGVMQLFLICAPLFKRESDNITSLSAAMILLLTANPYAAASAGLQLSFFATLGIILFTSRINNAAAEFMRGKRLSKKKIPHAVISYVTSGLAATTGALIFTLPLTALHFGYISLIAPVTNLLTIGVVSLTFPAALIACLTGFINTGAGILAAYPVTWAVRYITGTARLLSSVPYSLVYSSDIHIMIWLAYTYIMFITLPLLKARFRQYLYPACISVILLFAVILIPGLLPPGPDNSLTVLDVGQGLSVVASSGGYTMVTDSGSLSTNKAGEITHGFLQNAGCTSIDYLVITHFHDDHVNGIEFLLSRINVSVLVIPDPEGSYLAQDIIELARKKGTDIIYAMEALALAMGETRVIVYPPLGDGDENERGISVLIMGGINTLITGDMNSKIERTLLRFADLPLLDVLVTGHHGSKESTSEELLEALKPGIAVISVGKNSFGHPHPGVLERLLQKGITIYRTDETGHITIVS